MTDSEPLTAVELLRSFQRMIRKQDYWRGYVGDEPSGEEWERSTHRQGASSMTDPRPFSDLAGTGLLWLINASVFHPRGFALALHRKNGEVVGWSLLGDGTEPWYFEETSDEKFRAAEALFAEHRSEGS